VVIVILYPQPVKASGIRLNESLQGPENRFRDLFIRDKELSSNTAVVRLLALATFSERISQSEFPYQCFILFSLVDDSQLRLKGFILESSSTSPLSLSFLFFFCQGLSDLLVTTSFCSSDEFFAVLGR
jgi:hypothetical protein